MKLQGKVGLVTGAGSGFGRETAKRFAKEGAKLAVVDINGESLSETADIIRQQYPQTEIIQVIADVSKEDEVEHYVNQTIEAFGRIDAFFNNAGVEGVNVEIADAELEQFQRILSINLQGVFLGLKHVLKVMRRQKSGSIVNTSSTAALHALRGSSIYVTAKHGVVGLTKNAALEYAGLGINVNAVCPGPFMTNLLQNVARKKFPDNPEKFFENAIASIPAGRLGQPEEVANLVAFLVSDEAKFINGAIIPIDGGYTL